MVLVNSAAPPPPFSHSVTINTKAPKAPASSIKIAPPTLKSFKELKFNNNKDEASFII